MKLCVNQTALGLILGSLVLSASPFAAAAECNRACLQGLADKLLSSIAAHDPTALPLAHTYAATENSVPAALDMMVIWRTATAAKSHYYVIDPVSAQVFLIASIAEGPSDALLFGRIKVQEGREISEIELYTNRSRGQGGFQFDGDGPAHFPAAWTQPIGTEHRASRAELLQAGRSIFDTSVPAPPVAPGCVIMENGKVVAENPEVLKHIGPTDNTSKPALPANPDGTVPVPCGNPPERPTDKHARTTIIDEEQGVVVSFAVVHGVTQPYLVTNPTESAFVPDSLLKPYVDMLTKQQRSGRYSAPALRPMPATGVTAEVHRIYDGKLQGLQLLVNLGAPGSHSPWVVP